MVEFGKKLLTSLVEEWKEYYIDYGKLKSIIKKAVKAKHKQEQQQLYPKYADDTSLIKDINTRMSPAMQIGGFKSSPSLVTSDALSDGYVTALEFRRTLDHEIQKIVLFVLTREGQLAERLYGLNKDGQVLKTKILFLVQDFRDRQGNFTATTSKDKANAWARLQSLTDQHRGFAQDLLQFVNFFDTNLTGLRKILKKHDKNFPHNQLSGIYLQYSGRGTAADDVDGIDGRLMTDSHLEKLYHFGGVSALALTLRRAFDDLHLLELHLLTLSDAAKSATEHRNHRRNISMPLFPPQESVQDPVDSVITPKLHNRKSSLGVLPAIFPQQELKDQTGVLHSPRRPTHLIPTTTTYQREPILDQINAARNRLRQTTKYAELVAAQALIFFDDKDQDSTDGDKTPASEFTAVQKLSSFLNLISSFLYMTNYYIVAPTVGNYALRLGSDESMAGIIIGMTPNAALIATVLYGFWSNYSYRNALIFASTSSFFGNIFYAMALKHNSIKMVMIGRFLVGFGSARSINRRYIADVFSKADRTVASADFVTYAALGMAAGPAAAFGLGHLTFDPSSLLWSDINAPGWIMVFAWGVFIVFLVSFFEEPDRSHLYINQQKDQTSPEKMELTVTKADSYGSLYSNGDKESEPLLVPRAHDDGNEEISVKVKDTIEEPPLWKNVPVMISLWMYFVLKLVLEMLMSSTGTVTKHYFNWNSKNSGLFMASVGLLMFPVNFVVAKLSQKYEDRELITVALIIMLISVVGIIDYSPTNYSVYQYMIFGVGIFVSTNGLEGVNMSLLSKTIPASWARGTFNSGFLATEAGTLARSVGDVLISTIAGIFGMDMILNGLFTPMALLCGVSLLMVHSSYSKLTDMDDDDDDDDDTASAVSSEGSSLSKKL